MKAFVFLIIVVLVQCAYASEWVRVDTWEDSKHNQVYIDADSVDKTNSILTFWSKTLTPSGKYTATQYKVDCDNGKVMIVDTYSYDKKGKVIAHNQTPTEWKEFPADSKVNAFYRLSCNTILSEDADSVKNMINNFRRVYIEEASKSGKGTPSNQ